MVKSICIGSLLVSSLAFAQTPSISNKIDAIQSAQIGGLRSDLDTLLKNTLSGVIQQANNDEFYQVLDSTQTTGAGTFILTVTTRSSSVPGRGKVSQFALSVHIAGSSTGSLMSVHTLGGEGGGADFTSSETTPNARNVTVRVQNHPGGTWQLQVGHQHGEIQSLGYSIEAYSR